MLLILLTLVFVILRLLPGDACLVVLGGRAFTQERLTECRHELRIDRPLTVQYTEYLISLAQGDFGVSIRTRDPVLRAILERFPASLELAVLGMLIAVLVGTASGILAAVSREELLNHSLRLFNIASFSVPAYWVGLMLIMLFAVTLKWLPVGGRLDPIVAQSFRPLTGFYLFDTAFRGNSGAFADALRHLLLPACTLGLWGSGFIGRMTRSSILDVMRNDYITVARSKGLPERAVLLRHALKNALIPIVTVMGLQCARLVGGALLTETVFSWPGIARYILDSIDDRDFPAIQGTVVFIALLVSVVNLLVDVLYARIDPKVRYS